MSRAKATYDLVAENRGEAGIRSFQRSLRKAAGAIGRAGIAAAGAGIAGFAVMAKKAIDAGDRIQKLSIQTGLSTEFLSESRFVASQAGTSLEAMAKASAKASKNLLLARDGSKQTADAFKELGLNVTDLISQSPDEQFAQIGDALSKVKNESLRAALAQTIFGRSGLEILPVFEKGRAGMEAMRKAARESGRSMSRDMADGAAAANDAVGRLTSGFQGIVEQLTLKFAPGIADVVDSFRKNVIPILVDTISFMGRIIDAAAGFAAAGVSLVKGEFSGAKRAFGDALDSLLGKKSNGPADTKKGDDLLRGIQEIAKNTRETAAIAG